MSAKTGQVVPVIPRRARKLNGTWPAAARVSPSRRRFSVLSRDTIMEEFSPGAPACAATIPKSQQSILPPQARNTALIITEIVRSSLQSLSVLNVEA